MKIAFWYQSFMLFVLVCNFVLGVAVAALLSQRRTRAGTKLFLRAMFTLLPILCLVVFSTGCNTLSTISAMLPALTTLVENVVAFIVGLKGGEVSASVVSAIQGYANDIATEITNVQAIIAAATSSNNTTTIQKLQAAFGAIMTQLSSILSGANITDSATVTTLQSLVGLAVASVQTILGIIASLAPAAAAYDAKQISVEDAETADQHASDKLKAEHNLMKHVFSVIVKTPTSNPDVNASLAQLKPLP